MLGGGLHGLGAALRVHVADQGDLCRTMRRTMEVLRPWPCSPASTRRWDRARAALNIDRAPVTDEGYVTLSLEDAESEDAAEVEDAE